jgi:hypothetical protein
VSTSAPCIMQLSIASFEKQTLRSLRRHYPNYLSISYEDKGLALKFNAGLFFHIDFLLSPEV